MPVPGLDQYLKEMLFRKGPGFFIKADAGLFGIILLRQGSWH